ncbi:Ribonuclease/ribotoxin [Xylariales sp. PMI_506]|nr:Ribonuclease/ribotoxin [Xylariales sp. PMI_506]
MVNVSYMLTMLFAAAGMANPTAFPELDARSGQVYTCNKGANNDGAFIGKVSQDKAIGYFRDAKTKTGTASGYPKPFENNGGVMKFASGCTGNVWELPVLASGQPYQYAKKKDGNNPGPMRVYYTSDLKFCGIGAKSQDDNSGPPHNCAI